MSPNVPSVDFRDFLYLAPAMILAAWGLVVLLTDLALVRRMSPAERRVKVGWLSLFGVAMALIAAIALVLIPQSVRTDPESAQRWLSSGLVEYFSNPDPLLFLGTLSANLQSGIFNILFVILLGLVIWISMAWSFTDDWGEYYALVTWAAVGMMLLSASEELVTLFLTLETMTICLYLSTAFERTRRRSAEAGLKYFVYGSVSSALFLFGLSLVYGLTGTTQLEAIRQVLASTGAEGSGLSNNLAGATALLLMLVGFGFKISAVPFHQWAPDVYEGAPASVTAWLATGSKLASFIALMKVFLHALQPWSNPSTNLLGPGWIGVIAILAAVTMTYGNFAALAQRNLKRMLAYSSIAHAGYLLVGVAAASVSTRGPESAGAVLYYLVVYAFANVGAFAVAAWLVRDKNTDDIDDLNGLGRQAPVMAVCILILMLSLIGIPPLAGFFGKLYMFMEALNQGDSAHRLTLVWLVALGLLNSVVSAFYYVRVLKALFLREPDAKRLAKAERSIELPVVLGTLVVVVFGILPDSLITVMRAAAVPMLTASSGGASATIAPAIQPLAAPPAGARPVTKQSAAVKSAPMSPEMSKAYQSMMKQSGSGQDPMKLMRGAGATKNQPKAAPATKGQR